LTEVHYNAPKESFRVLFQNHSQFLSLIYTCSGTRVSTHPADKIDELLPGEWKKLNAEADADLGDDTAKIVRVA